MNPIAKAATGGAIKAFNDLLSNIFGPIAEGLGLLISQPMKERALNNQLRNLKKLQEKCKKEKINIKQINLKVLYPYLEGIALEEEPELEELWANLMTNYLDTRKNLDSNVYPQILKQLSTIEIHILKRAYNNMSIVTYRNKLTTNGKKPKNDFEIFKISEAVNLERLGLITEHVDEVVNRLWGVEKKRVEEAIGEIIRPQGVSRVYCMTLFGRYFYEACQREKKQSKKKGKNKF